MSKRFVSINSKINGILGKGMHALKNKNVKVKEIVEVLKYAKQQSSYYHKKAYQLISKIVGFKVPSDVRISSIAVQQMVYDAIVDYTNGERNEKLINKLAFELRKAILNDIKLRKRTIITMSDHGTNIKEEELYEKYTVFEFLKNKKVIPASYHMALLRHIDNKQGDHSFVAKQLASLAKKGLVVVASKSAATKIIYKKTKDFNVNNHIKELAKAVKVDKWLAKNTKNGKILYKAVSKLGVLLLRNGTQFVPDNKISFVIKDFPEADGVVAFVRPGILNHLFEKSGFNGSYAFQGTIADPDLGMYGKGTFIEVPNAVFDAYDVPDHINMIINKDSIIGNVLYSRKKEHITDSSYMFVMNSSTDYSPSAQLSRQFITYLWGTDKKDYDYLVKLTEAVIEKLQFATNDGTYERLVLHGFNNKSFMVYHETLPSFTKGFIKQHTTIDLKYLELGDSHIIIGLPDKAFRALLKAHRVFITEDMDIRKVVLLPKTTALKHDNIAKGIRVGMFKNPVTPTKDCPGEYTAFIGKHTGAIAFCHADSDHRLKSGHDYDGDNVVVFHGDILDHLRSKDELYDNLANIKLKEKDTYVSSLADIIYKIYVQVSTPIGLFEYGVNTLWSLKDKACFYNGKLNTNFDTYGLGLIGLKQIQGWISAQKKDIEGLINANLYNKEINNNISTMVIPVRTALGKLSGLPFYEVVNKIRYYKKLNFNKRNNIMRVAVKNLNIIGGLIEKYFKLKDKTGEITTEIYNLKQNKFIKGKFKLNHQTLAYATLDTFHSELKKEVKEILNTKEFFMPLLNFGKAMAVISDLRKIADKKLELLLQQYGDNEHYVALIEENRSMVSSYVNDTIFSMNIMLYAIVADIRKKGKFHDFAIWCAAAQKTSASVFFNCASYRFIDEMILCYDYLINNGKIKDQI